MIVLPLISLDDVNWVAAPDSNRHLPLVDGALPFELAADCRGQYTTGYHDLSSFLYQRRRPSPQVEKKREQQNPSRFLLRFDCEKGEPFWGGLPSSCPAQSSMTFTALYAVILVPVFLFGFCLHLSLFITAGTIHRLYKF